MEFLVATLETERKHRNASQLPRENNLQPRIQHPGKPPIKSEDRLKTLSVMQLCPTLISSEFCLRKALEGLFLHREGVNRVNGAVGCWIQASQTPERQQEVPGPQPHTGRDVNQPRPRQGAEAQEAREKRCPAQVTLLLRGLGTRVDPAGYTEKKADRATDCVGITELRTVNI